MKMKITNALLSAVFNQDITEHNTNGGVLYWYTRNGGITRSHLSVYEFTIKCKEWASDKGASFVTNDPQSIVDICEKTLKKEKKDV